MGGPVEQTYTVIKDEVIRQAIQATAHISKVYRELIS